MTWRQVQALIVNTGLDEIAKYADAIGPWKETIAPGSGTNLPIIYTTNLVDRCPSVTECPEKLPSCSSPARTVLHCLSPLHSLLQVKSCLLLQGARSWPAGAPVHIPQRARELCNQPEAANHYVRVSPCAPENFKNQFFSIKNSYIILAYFLLPYLDISLTSCAC